MGEAILAHQMSSACEAKQRRGKEKRRRRKNINFSASLFVSILYELSWLARDSCWTDQHQQEMKKNLCEIEEKKKLSGEEFESFRKKEEISIFPDQTASEAERRYPKNVKFNFRRRVNQISGEEIFGKIKIQQRSFLW